MTDSVDRAGSETRFNRHTDGRTDGLTKNFSPDAKSESNATRAGGQSSSPAAATTADPIAASVHSPRVARNQYSEPNPVTAEELHRLYHGEQMSQAEIAACLGMGQPHISRLMKRAGIQSRRAVARDQSGSRNGNWRGGRVMQGKRAAKPNIKDSGYWYIWMPTHPNATKSGYVGEHVAVGAPEGLAPGEVVHHINLRKHDNRPENLIKLTRKQHAEVHAQLSQLAGQMVESGLVIFDGARYSVPPTGGDAR